MNTKPLVFLIVTLLLSASHAQADTPPRVGVFTFQSIEQNLQRNDLISMSRKLLLQFDQNDQYKVVRAYPLTGGRKPAAPANNTLTSQKKQELADINQQLSEAVQKMTAKEFEQAIPVLKSGLIKAAKLMRWSESFPIVSRICGLWALAAFRLGRSEEGELLLKVLARLNPQPAPPEIKANPQMNFRYKRILRSINKGPKGSIKVIGTEGATIYIDGQKRGNIPQEISNLPKGLHYIRVTYTGHEPWGKAISVQADTAATANAYLKAIPKSKPDAIQKQRIEMITNIQSLSIENETFSSAAQAVCLRTNIRHMFTAHLKAKGKNFLLTPIYIDCHNQKIRKGEEVPINGNLLEVEIPIYQAMLKLLRQENVKQIERRVAIIRRPPPPRTTPTTGTPVYKKWWFWTILTVTAAGGAAAVTTYYFVSQPPKLGVSATWSLK